MKKYRCQSCGKDWYSAADREVCPDCRGELEEVDMAEKVKAPSESATSAGADKINQVNNNTELKSEQVPEEILREITEMHKRFMEIYKHYNYNIAAIGSVGGVQMSSEGFLDTFDKYQLGCRDSSDYPLELFTEFNGVRVFAILGREEADVHLHEM